MIEPDDFHSFDQVWIDWIAVFRVGCDQYKSALYIGQFCFSHQSKYPFMIDDETMSSELVCYPMISIAKVL